LDAEGAFDMMQDVDGLRTNRLSASGTFGVSTGTTLFTG
jgi:hypothetical protein